MSTRGRDLLVLTAAALVARIVAVLVVPWPPFTDPAYYSMIAQRLTEGFGFTTPVLWSFIEVGSVLPDPAVLPVPSNAHWMPLTSIVSAASMAVFGPTYLAGTLPLVVLSALLVPLTYIVTIELWHARGAALLAAVLAIFAGPLLIMYPTIDNFAVFGATGAAAIYCSTRAVRAARPGPWLVAAGAFAGPGDPGPDRRCLPHRRRRHRLVRPPRLVARGAARAPAARPSRGASHRPLRSSPCWRRGWRATSPSSARRCRRPAATRCGSPSTTSSSPSATR